MNYAHSELVARAPGPSLTTAGRPRHPAAGGGDGAAGRGRGGGHAGPRAGAGLEIRQEAVLPSTEGQYRTLYRPSVGRREEGVNMFRMLKF